MAIKVLIKRNVPVSKEKELAPLMELLRNHAKKQPGYIAGELLNRIDKPGEDLIISMWESMDEWRQWVLSEERKEIQIQIENLLGEPTVYEIYEIFKEEPGPGSE